MLRLKRHNDIRLRGNKFCNPFLIILVIDVNLITRIVLAKKKGRGGFYIRDFIFLNNFKLRQSKFIIRLRSFRVLRVTAPYPFIMKYRDAPHLDKPLDPEAFFI